MSSGSGAIGGPTLTLLGVLYCARGDWQAALNTLEAIAERVRHGRLMFEPIILAYLAEAYLAGGAPVLPLGGVQAAART